MATTTTVAARTTALLTGNGTVDYGADLDMGLTLDGVVTIEITGTKGNLTNIISTYYDGAGATPTNPISTGTAVVTETITDASWVRSVTLQTKAAYFRVGVAGTGADASSSDAVINYYYQPNALGVAVVDGAQKITS